MAYKIGEPLTREDVRQRIVLSGGELCATAGVSEGTVRAWIREGIVPTVKIGGRVFFPAAGVMALLGDDGSPR